MFYTLILKITKETFVKDDFQSVLRSLRTLMFINIITAHSMECESMLFVKNPNLIFETFQILFSPASLTFTAVKVFIELYIRENEA